MLLIKEKSKTRNRSSPFSPVDESCLQFKNLRLSLVSVLFKARFFKLPAPRQMSYLPAYNDAGTTFSPVWFCERLQNPLMA